MKILMVRPFAFGFNAETHASNSFQNLTLPNQNAAELADQARHEFDQFVATLKSHEVDVHVVEDTAVPIKPDAIFPNNWFSTHHDRLVTYPMLAPIRRYERRDDLIASFIKDFQFSDHIALEHYESQNQFLEGTGSLLLDRVHNKAYASLSSRTDKTILAEFCERMQYTPIIFTSSYQGSPIYHTNVMLSIGTQFAVICSASIESSTERDTVLANLTASGHEIIDVSLEQMNQFCCNILEIRNQKNEALVVMSQTAYDAFTPEQRQVMETYGTIVAGAIPTIERIGGGSARCMIAEIFD